MIHDLVWLQTEVTNGFTNDDIICIERAFAAIRKELKQRKQKQQSKLTQTCIAVIPINEVLG